MKYQQIQKQILELSPGDHWALLKLIVESLQPARPIILSNLS